MKSWLKLAIKDLGISILAYPLAPYIAYISMKREVPSRFKYWLTHDSPIDGDSGHMARHPDNGTKIRVWKRRTYWLWRNKGYTYSFEVNGVVPEGKTEYRGKPLFWTQENPRGWCYAKCDNAWMFFAWFPYKIFGYNRGVRFYLGWKLRYYCEHPDKPKREMLVTHFNPIKGVI